MAKANFTNNVFIRGYVFSHTLQARETADYKYISGLLNVTTDDEALNVVPVNFFVREKTKSGGTNATYANLKQIIDTNNTFENAGTDALRVRIDGTIDVNDFYNREGELVTGKRVRGSFCHFLNAAESMTPAAQFEADVLLQAAVERESNDGSAYLSLQGFAFNYRGDVLPVTFSISSPEGMAFFENEDISAANPYFGKVCGDIRSNVVVTKQETDDTQVAFGAPMVHETSRTFRTWEVVAANVNSGMDESTITQEELEKGIKERETRLADLKAKTAERNGSASGAAGFPASAAPFQSTAPAANDKNYVF